MMPGVTLPPQARVVPLLGSHKLVAPRAGIRAQSSQKNQGLYFDYEPVDPEAHKQLPKEKSKVVEEFSWVQRARGEERTGRPQRKKRPSRPPSAGRSSSPSAPSPASSPTDEAESIVAETAGPSSAQATVSAAAGKTQDAGPQPSTSSPPPATAPAAAPPAAKPAAPVAQSTASTSAAPAASSTADVSASTERRPGSRKNALLARLSGGPSTSAAASQAADITQTPTHEATEQPTQQVTQQAQASCSPSDKAMPAASAAASALSLAALGSGAAAAVPRIELPPLPAANSAEDEEALAALRVIAGVSEEDMRSVQSKDLSAQGQDEQREQAEFAQWLAEVQAVQRAQRASNGNGNGNGHGNGVSEEEREMEAQLQEAADVELSVSALLSESTKEWSAFRDLLDGLAAADTSNAADSEDDERDVPSEDQILAQLRQSDPALFSLLGPNTDGIDWEKDQQELEDALDTLERLGLGPNAPTTAPTTDAASQAGDSDPSEDEDLISDEELEMLARSDPDLAKLLRSNSLGRGFEELVGGEAGGDDDVAYDGEEEGEGAELADLFDALDEDEELEDSDRARARAELQGIFNPSAGPRDAAVKKAVPSVQPISTTGRPSGPDGGDVPQLMPRPQHRGPA